jgi:ABC-type polysaccharide/polyol phosphate transport system ATPase subunit
MSAKLGFAVAAKIDAPIMLLDEVVAVGDFVFQKNALHISRSASAAGKPSFSSHIPLAQ